MNSNYKLRSFNLSNCSDLELQAIFKLNQQNTPEVGSLDSTEHLKRLIELSAYNLLMLSDEEIIGFIICMREGSIYESENYKFFKQRLKKFLYVDRVAIDERHRRSGLGKEIYEDIFVHASNGTTVSCTVVMLSNAPPRCSATVPFLRRRVPRRGRQKQTEEDV